MKSVLLGIAAASVATINFPAAIAAQGMAMVGNSTERVGEVRQAPRFGGDFCRGRADRGGDRQGDHRGRVGCRSDVVMDVYGGEWALYNNRSWEADSYNDWWHDRPERAYPAWMRHNQDCQRQWFSGDVLRC